MERFKILARWCAVALGAVALVVAFMPHRQDPAAQAVDPLPIDAAALPPASPAISAAVVTPSPPAASPSPLAISVYVCGAIRKPGVITLSAGSRVVDAVNRAGGLTKDADDEAINLAQPLIDGMKVDVPKRGAHVESPTDAGAVSVRAGPVVAQTSSHRTSDHHSTGRSGTHKLQAGQTLDINTAGEAELTQLPGVGPSLARRIVEYRQANGPFATIDDIQNVSGVGPSKFAKMAPFLRTG